MPQYSITFNFEHGYSVRQIMADTAGAALAEARALYDADAEDDIRSEAEHYDGIGDLNMITAECSDPAIVDYEDYVPQEIRIRDAAPELLAALKAQDMAEYDREAGIRKGYFDHARELRKAVLAKIKA